MTSDTLIRAHIYQIVRYVNGAEEPSKQYIKEFKDEAAAQVKE